MGNPDASIKIVEFASLTCSHCAEFSLESHDELKRDFIDTGRVSLELRNFIRDGIDLTARSEEHTSELQSLMRISYAVFCLKKKKKKKKRQHQQCNTIKYKHIVHTEKTKNRK